MKLLKTKGFTLIEVLIAMGILVVCIVGILGANVAMFALADIARGETIANNAAQYEMEKLKKEDFDNLNNFNENVFYIKYTSAAHTGIEIVDAQPADASLILGVGRIEVGDVTTYTKSSMKQVRVTVSYKSLKRVVGGDKNLNGVPDAGDTLDADGDIDSPIELITLIIK